ncbi:MAG: hypothetical protein ACR2P4_01805 [Gammaproteobacteria bacterium]
MRGRREWQRWAGMADFLHGGGFFLARLAKRGFLCYDVWRCY